MARIILLDAGPLGLLTRARGIPVADQCHAWLAALEASGAGVVAPEIADYEVRRELLRLGATAGLRRLDALKAQLVYLPLTTAAMLAAAEFWALIRRAGVPTAGPGELDADAILAGQADTAGGPSDTVTIATSNVRHLGRFPRIDARPWATIT